MTHSMQYFKSVFLSLFLIFSSYAAADQYKTVNQTDSGMTSTYWRVPSDFKCKVKDEAAPTAFCKGPGDVIYHLAGLGNFQYALNPDQYIDNLIQQVKSQANITIVKRYNIPELQRHLLQQDGQMLFKSGQQSYGYVFDVKNHDEAVAGVNMFVVNIIPNSGSPMSIVDFYGLTEPLSKSNDFGKIRKQFIDFMLSKRYDNQYLQALNTQSMQFQTNLSARESNFYSRQNQIHQNNMDALDSSHNAYQKRSAASDRSHNAYRQRSAASDRMQSQSVDSIYERQQMIDPNTGNRYEVEGYYDYNYVNPNDPDNYRQSNDALYDPNINTNQGEHYNQLQEYSE